MPLVEYYHNGGFVAIVLVRSGSEGRKPEDGDDEDTTKSTERERKRTFLNI